MSQFVEHNRFNVSISKIGVCGIQTYYLFVNAGLSESVIQGSINDNKVCCVNIHSVFVREMNKFSYIRLQLFGNRILSVKPKRFFITGHEEQGQQELVESLATADPAGAGLHARRGCEEIAGLQTGGLQAFTQIGGVGRVLEARPERFQIENR